MPSFSPTSSRLLPSSSLPSVFLTDLHAISCHLLSSSHSISNSFDILFIAHDTQEFQVQQCSTLHSSPVMPRAVMMDSTQIRKPEGQNPLGRIVVSDSPWTPPNRTQRYRTLFFPQRTGESWSSRVSLFLVDRTHTRSMACSSLGEEQSEPSFRHFFQH